MWDAVKMPKKLVDYLKPLFIRVSIFQRERERGGIPAKCLNSLTRKLLTSHRNLYKASGIGTKIISKAARSSAWSRVKGGRVSSTLDKWKRRAISFCPPCHQWKLKARWRQKVIPFQAKKLWQRTKCHRNECAPSSNHWCANSCLRH